MTPRSLPAFASEAEEADWWYENREKHAEEFVEAFAAGQVREGGVAGRLADAQIASTVLIEKGDVERARILAERKGMDLQAYLSGLIHSSIQHELDSLQSETDEAA